MTEPGAPLPPPPPPAGPGPGPLARARRGHWLLKARRAGRDYLKAHPLLGRFSHLIFDKRLWRFVDPDSLARGWFIGSLSASTPFLGAQIVMALPFNILFHGNIPIALALILTTNPLTAPLYYPAAFWIGARILGTPMSDYSGMLAAGDYAGLLKVAWQPLMLGCLAIGLVVGGAGYIAIKRFWRPRRPT